MKDRILAILLRCLAPIVIIALLVVCAFLKVDVGTDGYTVTFDSADNVYEEGWCTQSFDINPSTTLMEAEFNFSGTLTEGTLKIELYDNNDNHLKSWSYNAGESVSDSYDIKLDKYGDGKYYHYTCTFTQNAKGSLDLSNQNYAYLYKKLIG
jgi:hypothetical protein